MALWRTGKLVSNGATLTAVTPFQKNVHSLDNLPYSQIFRSPLTGEGAHFSEMVFLLGLPITPKESRLWRLDPRPSSALWGRCGRERRGA